MQNRRLTFDYTAVIISIDEGAADRRLSSGFAYRSKPLRWDLGGLLLFICLLEEADNADDQNADLNQIRISNHRAAPLS